MPTDGWNRATLAASLPPLGSSPSAVPKPCCSIRDRIMTLHRTRSSKTGKTVAAASVFNGSASPCDITPHRHAGCLRVSAYVLALMPNLTRPFAHIPFSEDNSAKAGKKPK